MARDPAKANTCTVELSTGSFVEVAQTPEEVLRERGMAMGGSEMMEIVPLIGSSRPDAEWREKIWIDPLQVVAVYPLDERSQPPRQVSLDRVEARDKT